MGTSITNELLLALQRLEQNNQQFQNAMREEVEVIKTQLKAIGDYIGQTNPDGSQSAESLKEYAERVYGPLMRQQAERETERRAYHFRRSISKLWFRKLNGRKMAFFQATRCRKQAVLLTEFLDQEVPFIPRKFMEIILESDPQEIREAKMQTSVEHMEKEIDHLLSQSVKATETFTKIDDEMKQVFIKSAEKDIISKVDYLWCKDTQKEEKKSQQRWENQEKFMRRELDNRWKKNSPKNQPRGNSVRHHRQTQANKLENMPKNQSYSNAVRQDRPQHRLKQATPPSTSTYPKIHVDETPRRTVVERQQSSQDPTPQRQQQGHRRNQETFDRQQESTPNMDNCQMREEYNDRHANEPQTINIGKSAKGGHLKSFLERLRPQRDANRRTYTPLNYIPK